jgi:hypothetical protein
MMADGRQRDDKRMVAKATMWPAVRPDQLAARGDDALLAMPA